MSKDNDAMLVCKQCKVQFVISNSDRKRGRGIFCSRNCYIKSRTSKPYTYHALHTWLWRNYRHIKTGICSHCGNKANRTEWANISKKYLKDIKDYIELCKPCHDKYDNHKHDQFRGYKHSEETKQKIANSVRRNRWGII